MNSKIPKNNFKLHIWISFILFILCLFFPGFYTNTDYSPPQAYQLLLSGFLGAIYGHFSWFANVFFLIAIYKWQDNEAKHAANFGFIAIAFALSFLFYSEIATSEAPTFGIISAYGWGYYLWITSIGTFAVGQYSLSNGQSLSHYRKTILSWISFTAFIYLLYYFVGFNSQHSIAVRRSEIFNQKCSLAGEHVFQRPHNTKGIFFGPGYGVLLARTDRGDWNKNHDVLHGRDLTDARLISFYELINGSRNLLKSFQPKTQYTKSLFNDYKEIDTNSLESEYAVLFEKYDIPENLNIEGAKVIIKDRSNESIIASTDYIFDPIEKKFCGKDENGIFSTEAFIINSLELSKQY